MSRAAIEELLHAGHSDKAIARQLHIRRLRVRAVRDELGLPIHKPGPTAASTPEDLFWRRAQPTSDGHLIWPGYNTGHGHSVKHQGRKHSIHRIAWNLAHDRQPVGHVTTGCGIHGCIHPRHVEDQTMRDQYDAIFGDQAA
ncbi:hypothetical protein ACFY2M_19535 [Streptomyces sp. NPDC001276]|uniref:hypothetical protein n=1 Tax=Streptomyces sp. NPDC001276 TaxID=3364555 RepID=UPI0036AF3BB0